MITISFSTLSVILFVVGLLLTLLLDRDCEVFWDALGLCLLIVGFIIAYID